MGVWVGGWINRKIGGWMVHVSIYGGTWVGRWMGACVCGVCLGMYLHTYIYGGWVGGCVYTSMFVSCLCVYVNLQW